LSENITSSFGNRKNGSSVVATRKNPSNALGVNNGNAEGTFVSLGYGGEMVYKFPVVVANGAGDDLKFYEVTNGRNTYPTETATVQISQDGTNWFPVVGYTITSEPGGDGIIFVEVSSSGLTQFQYVKIKDTTNAALNPDGLSDGYDLDAVQAMYGKACSS